jgi:DNA-binding response OmpR family regulator
MCPDRRAVARGGRRPYDRPGHYPKLLIADSYEGARVPCARYLDHFGFHVDQAADGQEALAAMEAGLPHLLLVEHSLPKLPASGLVEWIEKAGHDRQVPVILMLSDFDAVAPRDMPPSAAVLVKPFPLSTMLQEVRRALRLQSVAAA